jgi:hypothetical protein
MSCLPTSPDRTARLRALAAGLLVLCAACADESAGPSSTADLPADPVGSPVESTDLAAAVLDTRSSQPGIVFGSVSMENEYLNNVHTGWLTGGPLDPKNILSKLSGARAKGGRVVIKLCKGSDSYVKNGDGTFSLTKWKSLVSRYRDVNLDSYISDGTIVGHYLIDEPHRTERWGGKAISQATLEAMAKHSKELWPQMTTMVRVVPSWLESASLTYKYLDAGWTQYTAKKGDAAKWVTAEAEAAKRKGLGLVVGMNVIDGGNGSSGIRGMASGKWAMSASELRNYGSAMLGPSHACAFFNAHHETWYYGRSDIKSAMADVSAKAQAHAKTSCRQ